MKIALTLAACLLGACATPQHHEPTIDKLTPLLTVEAIEPSLGFWTTGLGFEVVAEVPSGEQLAFVMLQQGALEVMLQSTASVFGDNPDLGRELSRGPTCLYIEVADLDRTLGRLGEVQVVVPRKETFYGTTEVFVRTPGGHIVGLSQLVGGESQPEG